MNIENITLKNFRNYASQTVSLGDNLNVIVGNNAQGKTNLLESVFLCAIGRSPRTTKDKDLIEWNSQFARVSIDLKKNVGKSSIDLYLFRNQNKAIKINQIGIQKIGQLLGVLNAIYFSPDELKLIKESPEERRRFMDIDLCQFDRNYFYDLNNYNKILQQRNKLLKSSTEQVLKDTITIWNEQLASYGAKIIMSRLSLIENLKPVVKNIHKMLTSNKEELEISYQGLIASSENDLKILLLKKYEESLEKDIRLGFTSVGPHRDDIKIAGNRPSDSIKRNNLSAVSQEVLPEERRIGEIESARHLLNGQLRCREQGLGVDNDRVRDPRRRAVIRHLARYDGQILGRDAELVGIILHLA